MPILTVTFTDGTQRQSHPWPGFPISVFHPEMQLADTCIFSGGRARLGSSVKYANQWGIFSYRWSPGASLNDATVQRPIATPDETTTYSVTIIDSGGCVNTQTVTVHVTHAPPPAITPSGPITICPSDSVALTASAGFSDYAWSNGATGTGTVVRDSGTYVVSALDTAGCRQSAAVSVAISPFRVPAILACGDTMSVEGYDSAEWYLSGLLVGRGASVVGVAGATYEARVVDSLGCRGTAAAFTLAGPSEAAFAVRMEPDSAAAGDTVSAIVSVARSSLLRTNRSRVVTLAVKTNASILYPVGATPRGTEVGAERIIAASITRPDTTGPVDTLRFVAALGDTDVTTVGIDSVSWDLCPAITSVSGATFHLLGVCREGGSRWFLRTPIGFGIASIEPFPAIDRATIEFDAIEQGPTQLELRDALGTCVRTIDLGAPVAGHHAVQIDLLDLATGIYTCGLRTPTGISRRLLVHVR
jgi:hypothetical protein